MFGVAKAFSFPMNEKTWLRVPNVQTLIPGMLFGLVAEGIP
jgi:hypothetical protein